MKFESGDKVRVVNYISTYGDASAEWLKEKGIKIGDVYTVDRFESYSGIYYMKELCPKAQGNQVVQLYGEEIDYARVIYSKLAAKIYPKGYKEGEWWILT
jgi:hypothetical protein